MNKEFLNNLIKKSDLTNTDYLVYNKSKTYKKQTDKINYEKLEYPNFNNYIVLDFETTGFSYINDDIIEIGAIKVIDGKIVSKFETLINPKRPIPPYISEKIHITNDMVKNKPFIENIFKDFYEFLEDLPIVIQNANFDMKFLITNANKLNFEIKNKAFDTISSCKNLFPELKKYNLSFLCKYFDIQNKTAHRAISDVMATNELYQILHNKFLKNL